MYDIEFERLLASDFLEHYDRTIDFKYKKLVTNSKTIQLFKATDNTIMHKLSNQSVDTSYVNRITIDLRTEHICRLI